MKKYKRNVSEKKAIERPKRQMKNRRNIKWHRNIEVIKGRIKIATTNDGKEKGKKKIRMNEKYLK